MNIRGKICFRKKIQTFLLALTQSSLDHIFYSHLGWGTKWLRMQLRESELGLMETGEERQKSLAGYVWRDGMYKPLLGS